MGLTMSDMLIRLRFVIIAVQRLFMRPELHLVKRRLEYEPVFIIGAPRSGTTLLFQLLAKYYNVGFITNIMALFPMFMSTIACIFSNRILSYSAIKESNYGVIAGLHSPNEGGKINAFWFSDRGWESHSNAVRDSFAAIGSCLKAPILIKALGNSLAIEAIITVFPKAKFIYIKREPIYVAQSLLVARKKVLGDMNAWFSVRPNGYEEAMRSLSVAQQVVWQVREIDTRIIRDLERLDPTHIIVHYEDLASQPEEVLDEISNNLHLKRKSTSFEESEISVTSKRQVSDFEWEDLKKAVQWAYSGT